MNIEAKDILSDDSWNQTAADNPEWLMRFKRDAGIDQMETSRIKGSEQN